jgi:hypothetical protein
MRLNFLGMSRIDRRCPAQGKDERRDREWRQAGGQGRMEVEVAGQGRQAEESGCGLDVVVSEYGGDAHDSEPPRSMLYTLSVVDCQRQSLSPVHMRHGNF